MMLVLQQLSNIAIWLCRITGFGSRRMAAMTGVKIHNASHEATELHSQKTEPQSGLHQPPFTSQRDSFTSVIFSAIVFISERGATHIVGTQDPRFILKES